LATGSSPLANRIELRNYDGVKNKARSSSGDRQQKWDEQNLIGPARASMNLMALPIRVKAKLS
jgi:hypothetical protein